MSPNDKPETRCACEHEEYRHTNPGCLDCGCEWFNDYGSIGRAPAPPPSAACACCKHAGDVYKKGVTCGCLCHEGYAPAPVGGGEGAGVLTEPFTWERVAFRVGEELAANGPRGYYNMTPPEWQDFCLAACYAWRAHDAALRASEAALAEKCKRLEAALKKIEDPDGKWGEFALRGFASRALRPTHNTGEGE